MEIDVEVMNDGGEEGEDLEEGEGVLELEELELLLTRLEDEHIADSDKIEIFNKISWLLEIAETKYQEVTKDPLSERERNEHLITQMQNLIDESGDLLTGVIYDHNVQVNISGMRLLIGFSPNSSLLSSSPEEDESLVNKLIHWMNSNSLPLRVYSTGLLVVLAGERNLSALIISKGITLLLLTRINECIQQGLHLNFIFPVPSTFEPYRDYTTQELKTKELVFLLELFASIGEYQEILVPFFQEGGLNIVIELLKVKDKLLLLDTLEIVAALLSHRKFGTSFIEAGGLQSLIEIPRITYLSGPLGLCFFGLSSISSVMEHICLNTDGCLGNLIDYVFWMFQSESGSAKKNTVLFFSMAFAYKSFFQLFDNLNGIKYFLEMIRKILLDDEFSLRDEGGVLAGNVCLALRQYFRMSLVLIVDNVKRRIQKTSRFKESVNPIVPITGYKNVSIDTETVKEAAHILESNRSAASPFISRSRWFQIENFVKQDGILLAGALLITGLKIWRRHDVVEFVLDILFVITLAPFTHPEILSLLSDRPNIPVANEQKSVIGIVLSLIGDEKQSPEIVESALRIIVNCVARTHSTQLNKTKTTPNKTPMKSKSNILHSETSTLDDHILKRVWKSVRANNGIKVLLSALKYRSSVANAESIRYLACKALLGLAGDANIAQVLGRHQQLSKLLPELMRESSQNDKTNEHKHFIQAAIQLLAKITGSNQVSSEAADPAVRKIERAAIVQQTNISYDPVQLLSLIQKYLQNRGLKKTAATLAQEANLGSVPPAPPGNSIENVVTQFLKDQHSHCANPIAVLPPLSLFETHTCPVPSHLQNAPKNVVLRFNSRQIQPPFGGLEGRSQDRKLIYSRFRASRSLREEETVFSSVSFLNHDSVILGTHHGEVKIFSNIRSHVPLVESWPVHEGFVWSVVCSPDYNLILTSTPHHLGESKLWKRNRFSQALFTFQDCYRVQFNSTTNQIVGTGVNKTFLFSIETGQLIKTFSDISSREKRDNCACFSPCGELILNDTLLWDPRTSMMLHKFDKFSNYGCGVFNPNGNEVIINSEIWDLRTFKLLKTCSALDQTVIKFNALGDVIFAVLRQFEKTHESNRSFPPYLPFTRVFRTLDATSYSLINTIDQERHIVDLAPEASDNFIALIENGSSSLGLIDSVCRIYEIGRRCGTDSDSGEESAMSEAEDEDGESDLTSDDTDTFGSFGSESFDSDDDLIGFSEDGLNSEGEVF